ncbi:MAG: hypothetical protein ACOC0C_08230 [Bacteroidota bacterium]
MKYRNLDKVRFLLKEAAELDIMYAYDDLIFPEHGAFLIQYDDKNEHNYLCYFQKQCSEKDTTQLFSDLSRTFEDNDCNLILKGLFEMHQNDEEIELVFSDFIM